MKDICLYSKDSIIYIHPSTHLKQSWLEYCVPLGCFGSSASLTKFHSCDLFALYNRFYHLSSTSLPLNCIACTCS